MLYHTLACLKNKMERGYGYPGCVSVQISCEIKRPAYRAAGEIWHSLLLNKIQKVAPKAIGAIKAKR